MAKRKYKFTNKHHSTEAICSLILGLVSLFGMASVIWLSYTKAGQTMPGYGMTGFLAMLFSVIGVILGLLSFRKRDCFRALCILATVLNLLVLLGTGFLFSLGMK